MDSQKQLDLGTWVGLQTAFANVASSCSAARAIEINGQPLALTPENAPKIRAAIQCLRHQILDRFRACSANLRGDVGPRGLAC